MDYLELKLSSSESESESSPSKCEQVLDISGTAMWPSNARAWAVQTTAGVELFPPDGSKMRKARKAWNYSSKKF